MMEALKPGHHYKSNQHQCPCHFHERTGLDPRKMRLVGFSDDVLYRTWLIVVDPVDEARQEHLIRPCQEGCTP